LNTPRATEVPAEAARALSEARARMRWRVLPGRYALLGFAESPDAADLAFLGGNGPAQVVREGGETTLLVPEAALDAALAAHPSARAQRGLAWIRFELPMDWELVGFLALVTGALAAEGVPLGAVCGYSRDHLFVAEPHLERARAALARLFPEA
jgi:uncharacterized protein